MHIFDKRVHAQGLIPSLVVSLVAQLEVSGGVRVRQICRVSRRLGDRCDLVDLDGYFLFKISFYLFARSLIAEVHEPAAEHQAQQTRHAYVHYQ